MKISVSLEADEVAYLDRYASTHATGSRSAAVAAAIRALRETDLQQAYAEAFAQWRESGDADAWESVTADGLDRS